MSMGRYSQDWVKFLSPRQTFLTRLLSLQDDPSYGYEMIVDLLPV